MKILWIDDTLVDENLHLTSRIEMVNALKKLNNEVELVLLYHRNKPSFIYNDFTIYKYKPGHIISAVLLQLKIIIKLLKSKYYEVIICSSVFVYACIFYKVIINKILGGKKLFILDVRSIPVEIDTIKKKLSEIKFFCSIKLAFKHFDGITAITEATKLELIKSCGIKPKSSFIWSSGVNVRHFNPYRLKTDTLKEALGLEDKFVVMYHGVFSMNRGIQNLIKAISIVKNSINQIFLLLVGKGEGEKEFEKLIYQLHLENNCKLIQRVSYLEIPRYINLADVGILPFPDIKWYNVSSPLKLLEYLSMGKCVILTNINAHTNILNNNPSAFFIENNHPETIADCIIKVANLGKENLKNIGKCGRKIVLDKFTWEKLAKGLYRYIKEELMKR